LIVNVFISLFFQRLEISSTATAGAGTPWGLSRRRTAAGSIPVTGQSIFNRPGHGRMGRQAFFYITTVAMTAFGGIIRTEHDNFRKFPTILTFVFKYRHDFILYIQITRHSIWRVI
jgi:hypothetical protein